MRLPYAFVIVLGIAACAPPPVPDSGAGAGFQDYPSYLRQREAALNTGTTAPVAPAFSTQAIGAAIDAADSGAGAVALPGADAGLAADPPRGDTPAGIASDSGEMTAGSAAISDEQDFSAVAARETIESDAERLARNREEYQVIQPVAVPERTGGTAPNIVEFALSTSHTVGTSMYKRSSLRLGNVNSACARFASPDLAQEAFLAAGGPEKDPKGIDPDGDGFACSWDPRPFRAALN
ncbi:MAG: hypothetical protein Q8P60_04180 [Pseudorhodobacter sp.]|nr:hypothetical protein [Pseudorhodobacter sp.]